MGGASACVNISDKYSVEQNALEYQWNVNVLGNSSTGPLWIFGVISFGFISGPCLTFWAASTRAPLTRSSLLLVLFISLLQQHASRELCMMGRTNIVACGHHTISSYFLLLIPLVQVYLTVTSRLPQLIGRVLSGHRQSGLSVRTSFSRAGTHADRQPVSNGYPHFHMITWAWLKIRVA